MDCVILPFKALQIYPLFYFNVYFNLKSFKINTTKSSVRKFLCVTYFD
jgi:hypothetical protein